MEQTFMTELRIKKVRHLHDITIPLSKTERKNLILTGKNGSGKTSVLKAMTIWLNMLILTPEEYWSLPTEEGVAFLQNHLARYIPQNEAAAKAQDEDATQQFLADTVRELIGNKKFTSKDQFEGSTGIEAVIDTEWNNRDCRITLNKVVGIYSKYQKGQFVLAYYGDDRKLVIDDVDHITKVHIKPVYGMKEKPARELGKYLADLEFTKSIAISRDNPERATQIDEWFAHFENVLRRIYGDSSLKLDFDIDTFRFSILVDGREPFDFNTMSMGYAAVFDIIADLMMRMESQHRYDLEGIVLIDEIETHLHVELQRQIVPILTELFPNIQFILTTHSPFILSSAPNSVIYDLEKHMRVENGMENLSYEGIVEGYFGVDRYSVELRDAFEEYKQLVTSDDLSNAQRARLAELRDYLDEVPDYLARDIAYEYSLLKLEYDD